jgi:hypothetical protein
MIKTHTYFKDDLTKTLSTKILIRLYIISIIRFVLKILFYINNLYIFKFKFYFGQRKNTNNKVALFIGMEGAIDNVLHARDIYIILLARPINTSYLQTEYSTRTLVAI